MLRSSRLKWVTLLLASAVFAGLGLLVYATAAGGRVGGVVVTVFFGVCALVAGVQLIAPPTLTLSPEGFTSRAFGRNRSRRWTDVESFVAIHARATGMVAIRLDPVLTAGSAVSAFARDFAGYDGGVLTDTYGMKASELADLLNEWRARFGPRTSLGQ